MGKEKIVVVVDKDLAEIMPGFLKNRQKDIVELAQFQQKKDFKSMQVIGHKLAGNAGGYGLEKLGEYGSQLEDACIKGELSKATDAIQMITDYITRLEVKFQ